MTGPNWLARKQPSRQGESTATSALFNSREHGSPIQYPWPWRMRKRHQPGEAPFHSSAGRRLISSSRRCPACVMAKRIALRCYIKMSLVQQTRNKFLLRDGQCTASPTTRQQPLQGGTLSPTSLIFSATSPCGRLRQTRRTGQESEPGYSSFARRGEE